MEKIKSRPFIHTYDAFKLGENDNLYLYKGTISDHELFSYETKDRLNQNRFEDV